MAGKFITIEGVEGVGKSTVASFIKGFLQKAGVNALQTREPGGTPMAEQIRALILATNEEIIEPETELQLFFAARKQHCARLINPSLASGKWVICDRFYDASFAYQGAGRAIDERWLHSLMELNQIPTPDLTILLNASPEIIKSRLAKRSYMDRIEQEKLEFFERVQIAYLDLAKEEPERYRILDGGLPLKEVQQQVTTILQQYL